MATQAKKTEAPETPATLKIWNALSRTDPAHTKQFSRAGGFKGTAIKPIWIVQRLTELFGPCGAGWGMGEPSFQVVPGEGETLVYCTVACWHGKPENRFYGVGGDKVVTKRKDGGQFHDDEAFKKAFTDAVGNAFKFLGVGADVHMGQFDDSKYVEGLRAEFSGGPPANDHNGGNGKDAPFPQGPARNKTELKAMVREFWREVEGCGDADELDALLKAKPNIALVAQLIKALPFWWEGGKQASGEPFEGLESVINRKQTDLAAGETGWQANPIIGG